MRRLRALWTLWRAACFLEDSRGEYRAASLVVVIEGGASLEEQRRIAVANGDPPPDPRTACEVFLYRDRFATAEGARGHTLVEALGNALDAL